MEKTVIVRGPTALIGDLECSKNRDRVKSALIETALIGDSLYFIILLSYLSTCTIKEQNDEINEIHEMFLGPHDARGQKTPCFRKLHNQS